MISYENPNYIKATIKQATAFGEDKKKLYLNKLDRCLNFNTSVLGGCIKLSFLSTHKLGLIDSEADSLL